MLPYSPLTVAEAIHARLDEAAAGRGRAALAIPGGRTPGPVLRELAALCAPFVRERLHLLWVDERAVPRGDEERNDAATLSAWESGGPLPAHVHPMPAERADLDAAAADYARVLEQATGGEALDVALLGIGEDGHVASLFPHHPVLDELDPVAVVADSPKPPPRRLTLTLPVLRRARHRVVIALGPVKGTVLARARLGPDRALPVSLVGDATWYVDDAAAAAAAGR